MSFSINPDTEHVRSNTSPLEDALGEYGQRLKKRHEAYRATLGALDTFWKNTQGTASIQAAQNVMQRTLADKYDHIQNVLLKEDPLNEKALDDALHDYSIIQMNIDSYHDMAAVAAGEKQFCDQNGDATSFADAKYVLKPDQMVIERGGLSYLIGRGVDFDKLSLQEQAHAQQAYEKERPNISPTRQLVAEKCAWENDYHGACIQIARAETSGQSPQLTDNHERALAAAEANISAELNKANPDPKKLEAFAEMRSGRAAKTGGSGRSFNYVANQLKETLENLPPPATKPIDRNMRSMSRGEMPPGMPIPPFIVMRLATRPGNALSMRQEEMEKPDEKPEDRPSMTPMPRPK